MRFSASTTTERGIEWNTSHESINFTNSSLPT